MRPSTSTASYNNPPTPPKDNNKQFLVSEDLSLGEAAIPIPVYNAIDPLDAAHAQRMPSKFLYTAHSVFDDDDISEQNKVGCKCKKGQCTAENGCPCVKRSKGIQLYEDRRLKNSAALYGKFYDTLMVECSPACCANCCAPTVEGQDEDSALCKNRMTPAKFNLPLEVHKAPVSGFGARTREWIQMGTFVGEFVGELLCEDEAPDRNKAEDYSYKVMSPKGEGGHYVDPTNYGNVTRFFNHSCFPNLEPIRFLSSHREESRAAIGFVAYRDIPPQSELTIDYSVGWWRGKLKKFGGKFYCLCDSPLCIRPAPNKPQLSLAEAKRLVTEIVKQDHKAFLEWKQRQKMARSAVATYKAFHKAPEEPPISS